MPLSISAVIFGNDFSSSTDDKAVLELDPTVPLKLSSELSDFAAGIASAVFKRHSYARNTSRDSYCVDYS